jgi:hypothetical protein
VLYANAPNSSPAGEQLERVNDPAVERISGKARWMIVSTSSPAVGAARSPSISAVRAALM